jgi:hypothetical protein
MARENEEERNKKGKIIKNKIKNNRNNNKIK